MAARRPRKNAEEDRWVSMNARVSELENRIRLLEAKMREVNVLTRAATPKVQKEARRAARARPRPRCPGCTLELPKGSRSEYCVWCGFMLTAVRARMYR